MVDESDGNGGVYGEQLTVSYIYDLIHNAKGI